MSAASTLVVTQQGAKLHLDGQRLQIRDRTGSVLKEVPLLHLEEILLFGSVELSSSVMQHALASDLPVILLTREGRFKGKLNPLNLKDARLRQLQYQGAGDPAFRLRLAQAFVGAKLENSRVLLRRRVAGGAAGADKALHGIRLMIDRLPRCQEIAEVMGTEGMAARYYFEGLRHCLRQDLGFEKRVRRPPTDPVNALLSFGYTILTGWVLSDILRAGLDPHIGNLHELSPGRPSLALDLMEECRPLVVDITLIGLVNRLELTPRDFFHTEESGIRMTERALGRYMEALKCRGQVTILHPDSGLRIAIRQAIRRQVFHYRDVLRGERTEYLPLRLR